MNDQTLRYQNLRCSDTVDGSIHQGNACVDAVWLICLLEQFWPNRSPFGVLSPPL